MKCILLTTIAFATQGIFAINDKQLKIPPEQFFNDVIKDSRAGLIANNGEDETKLDITQLVRLMQKNHKLVPLRDDDKNAHNKDVIIKSLEDVIKDNQNQGNTLSEEINDEESDWIEIKNRYDNDGSHRDRNKRTSAQGGYTHDPDTCQTYNDNLQKLWNTVSMYFNTTDAPTNKALHNIALIAQAYLDHQHNKDKIEKANTEVVDKIDDRTDRMIAKIQKILSNYNTNPIESIYEVISKESKANSDVDKDCSIINEQYLRTSIDLAYQIYLDNAGCRNEGDKKGLRQKKTPGPDNIIVVKGNGVRTDDATKKGQTIMNSETSKIQELSKLVFNLYGDYIDTADPSKGTSIAKSKLNLRSERDCLQAALRIFLYSIRSVIERFMNRSECEVDATLRTSSGKSYNPYKSTNLNGYGKSSDNSNKYSPVAPLKTSGNNNFGEFREYNHYNTKLKKSNALQSIISPINFYESRDNKKGSYYNYEVIPLITKLGHQTLTSKKVPQSLSTKNELNIPKTSTTDTASLFDVMLNSYKQAYLNKHINWNNNFYVRPAEVNYATTQKTIKYNTYLNPDQREDNANLYNILYADILHRNLQESEKQKQIHDKILELLNFPNNHDKITTSYFDRVTQNRQELLSDL